jgi:two-component system OmpR family sensor kinase
MMGLGRLFWKLFLGFWLTLVAAGLMVGTAVWIHQQQRDSRVEPALAAGPRAELLLRSAAATLRFGGEPALRTLMEEEARQARGPMRLYAVNEQGEDLLDRTVAAGALELARTRAASQSSDGSGATPDSGQPGAPAETTRTAELPGRSGVRVVRSTEGREFLLFVAPVANTNASAQVQEEVQEDSKAAASIPQQAKSRSRAGGRPRSTMRRTLLDPFTGIAIGLLSSLGFSALLAWYLTRPIRHLRHAFAWVADGRLETRVASLMGRRTDEIAALGHDFDRMAERLQNLIVAQRRLLHDVSHELRSPLARLHAAIGLARQCPARSAAMLERIEREAQRIDGLVGELLTLARLEGAAPGGEAQPVDVAELLEEVVGDAHFEARALARDIRLETAALSPSGESIAARGQFVVRGRADWLQRAFENVIRNAVRHTAAGTRVEVRLARAPSGAITVDISDSGPGVPADELESIFEPFNRGRQPPDAAGYGLGLAIARRAITAHGGSIIVSNRNAGGLLVTIALPGTNAPQTPLKAPA